MRRALLVSAGYPQSSLPLDAEMQARRPAASRGSGDSSTRALRGGWQRPAGRRFCRPSSPPAVGETPTGQPPRRRRYFASGDRYVAFLSPFQGFILAQPSPTACAVGRIFGPLRGSGSLSPFSSCHFPLVIPNRFSGEESASWRYPNRFLTPSRRASAAAMAFGMTKRCSGIASATPHARTTARHDNSCAFVRVRSQRARFCSL
jgi:hypothetical protein